MKKKIIASIVFSSFILSKQNVNAGSDDISSAIDGLKKSNPVNPNLKVLSDFDTIISKIPEEEKKEFETQVESFANPEIIYKDNADDFISALNVFSEKNSDVRRKVIEIFQDFKTQYPEKLTGQLNSGITFYIIRSLSREIVINDADKEENVKTRLKGIIKKYPGYSK